MSVYAVHLMDLQGWTQHLPVLALLRPVLDSEPVYLNGRQIDGCPVLRLTCDDERAAAIVATIRLKVRPDRLRMFRSETGRGGWKPV